jgi:hypothetical protein
MDNIFLIANESFSEALAGGIIGSLLDYIFPVFTPVTSSNVLQISIEVVGQFTLSSILVAEFYNFQTSRGLAPSNSPTGNIVLGGITLFVMQENLIKKYHSLVEYFKTMITSSFTGGSSSSGTGSGSKTTLATTQNATPNFEKDSPLKDYVGSVLTGPSQTLDPSSISYN